MRESESDRRRLGSLGMGILGLVLVQVSNGSPNGWRIYDFRSLPLPMIFAFNKSQIFKLV